MRKSKKILIKLFYLYILLFFIVTQSCKKQLEASAPVTSISSANVYSTDATAASVLTAIYSQMSAQNSNMTGESIATISLFPALSADELTLFNLNAANLEPYYRNNLSAAEPGGALWSNIYQYLFYANSAIEGLNSSTGLTPSVKQQLLGEAKFLRALDYFYLVNLYGNVPLVTSTDYKVNASLSRANTTLVWQQIEADLIDAQNLLSNNYLDATVLNPTTERVRPTKWAATALLARAYLYSGANDSAEAAATTVINNSSLFSLDTLNGVFLMNSNEAIWQLQPVNNNPTNTGDGALFNLPSTGPDGNSYPVYLSNYVVNAFEPGDLRKADWVDSTIANGVTYYYPYKYKVGAGTTAPISEYIMMLRLGEQYLIRAEARAKQNNVNGAQNDLNTIRSRAGLTTTAAGDQQTLLTAILHERQVELFTEWGNRWFDLKRFGLIDQVMSVVTPTKNNGSWNSYKALYPVPNTDILLDRNLEQNSGY
jgi:hypothetical protein